MKHRREILAIAVPAIISNITTPILSLVDVAVTGHIGDAVYIAAIALGGTAFNTLYWLFNFLRMGTTGLTAQTYGSSGGQRGATDVILFRSLAVGLFTGLFLLAMCGPWKTAIIAFMDADDATLAPALQYVDILVWGAPAVMLTYALSGWFLGMQDSKAQMWMALVTNVANIAISPLLVFGFGWGIVGVAVGTLLAQWLGLAVGLVMAWHKYRPRFPGFAPVLELRPLLRFFRVNTDIFLRTACLVAVTLWFTHAGAQQGTDVLAANALLLQLFMLFSYFMDGFAFAGEALAGKYAGASDTASLRSLIRSLMSVGFSFALFFGVTYAVFGEDIMHLLADSRDVVATASDYVLFAAAVPLCGFMAFVWDGIYVGLVRTRAMLASMTVAAIVFFAVWLIFRHSLGNNALWLAFNAYLLTRSIVQTLLYIFRTRK